MESVLQRLTRADVAWSAGDHIGLARSDSPFSSADHRIPRLPGLAAKLDHLDAVAAAVAIAGESLPAFPVLTTKVDHQRESSPVGSVHTFWSQEGP